MNVVSYLKAHAAATPDRVALALGVDDDAITYGALWQRVCRLSDGFASAGLAPGDRVICMVPMSIDLYAILLGLLKMGAVVVFVDPWIGGRQIAAFAAFAEPAAYVGIPKSHLLRALSPVLRRIRISVTTGASILGLPARYSLSHIEAGAMNEDVFESGPDDPALITFTSGSSGTPKGANRTHGFLSAQHDALKAEFPYEAGAVDMPMFPVFALNNLAQGLTSVVPDMDFRHVAEVNGARILEQISHYGCTNCTASPPFIDRVIESAGAVDSVGLRRILTGGAPVSNAQLKRWRDVLPDTEVQVVYGSTEAEPVAHLSLDERLEARNTIRETCPGFCVGAPCSRIEARIVNISRDALSAESGWGELCLGTGVVGELVVTGEHVCREYYHNENARKENKILDPEGRVWHRMGDTGYMDAEGRFWLTGRTHSTIFRGDERVQPQLVEQAVSDKAHRVAVVGMPDPEWGQRVVLVVEQGTATEAEFVSAIEQAGFSVDEVVFSNVPLPLDPRHNSKIDYNALQERLTGQNQ